MKSALKLSCKHSDETVLDDVRTSIRIRSFAGSPKRFSV